MADDANANRAAAGADSGSLAATAVAELRGLRVHDVSPTIQTGLPIFQAFEPPEITTISTHEEVGVAAYQLRMSEHTGTHVDAPFHFVPDGQTIDEVPIDALFLRPFKKYDLSNTPHEPGELIELDELKQAGEDAGLALEAGDVAIVDMGWERYLPDGEEPRESEWWGHNEPGLSNEACAYLADSGVVAVASDTPACDLASKDGEIKAAHGHSEHFLPRGILIVESLRGLSQVPPTGLFVALPLKIAGGTGSPLRILLLTE
jgi:kynurenine formamidase